MLALKKHIRQIASEKLSTYYRRDKIPLEYLVMYTVNILESVYGYEEGVDFTVDYVRKILDRYTWEILQNNIRNKVG